MALMQNSVKEQNIHEQSKHEQTFLSLSFLPSFISTSPFEARGWEVKAGGGEEPKIGSISKTLKVF